MPGPHTRTVRLGGAFAVLIMYATASTAQFPHEFRSIDGTYNNRAAPARGCAGVELLRLTTLDYGDGIGSPAGMKRPSARHISNVVVAQPASTLNAVSASDFVWQWGQFLDHDLGLTGSTASAEPLDIPVPPGDPFFDPEATGDEVIPFSRSHYRTSNSGVRQQINEVTAYIDASQVYGSDGARATALRTADDTGQLQTSADSLLPFNLEGLPNMPNADPHYFLAGDVRVNEQVGLTALHTLFVREHNRWAAWFRRDPRLSGDDVYQRARALVAAEMQAITYREFLPVLLGPQALAPYQGYNPDVDASIANVFSTAAFRVGHSMLSPLLLRLTPQGRPIRAGHLPLQDTFFATAEIILEGIEPLLRGLASQRAQRVDPYIVDAVRNFLFGPPGSGGVDLASLNIQRGRDHGLPSYNQVRADFGLAPVDDFSDISSDATVQANLQQVYDSVDDIDIWVGGLSEDPVNGGLVGETFFTIIKDQFERLRDGDRFWYQTYLPPFWMRVVERRTLATIIRENTTIDHELQDNVFRVPRRQRPQQTSDRRSGGSDRTATNPHTARAPAR